MTITNPQLSGDLLNYANTAEFKLTVSGSVIDVSSSSRFNIESLQVTYDGKVLTFTEIPTPHIGNTTFTYDNTVTLEMDLGSGLQKFFTGRIRQIPVAGKTNNEKVTYVAVGIPQLANEVTVTDDTGIAAQISYASNVAVVINTITFYGFPLWLAVSDLFTTMAQSLGAYGIPATIDSSTNLQSIYGAYLQQDLTLSNIGWFDALKQICENQPDRKPFFDDITQTWKFPEVLDAIAEEIQINTVNIPEFNYTLDFTDRASRITIVAPWNVKQTAYSQKWVACTAAWSSSLEGSWCTQRTFVSSVVGEPSAYYWVFRRWTIGSMSGRNNTAPGRFWVYFANTGWVPVTARIDWDSNTVTTHRPITMTTGKKPRWNPHHPGHVVGPSSAVIEYFGTGSLPIGGWVGITYPSSGYEGNCYSLFGCTRHKLEVADLSGLTVANARARLALRKDVIVNGTLIITGDPIPELINLQKRVTFTHPSNKTGLETITAIVNGYTYSFGRRGASQIELSTDVSALVQVK